MALAAALPTALPAVAQTAASDLAAFLAVSSLVTGIAADRLTGLTDALLAAFRGQGQALEELASLARQSPDANFSAAIRGTPLENVARALATAWYTGTVGTGPDARLLSYDDALVWLAAGMEAVPGQCAGEFGAWAEPPNS